MNDEPSRKKDVGERVAKPALYASIVETETKLRHVKLSRFEPKPVSSKVHMRFSFVSPVKSLTHPLFPLPPPQVGTREVNFPLTRQVYDYASMVDVGPNSGAEAVTKPKRREFRSTRKPEPKLSDYYQPSFDNVRRVQMDSVETTPELTVQYDGMAVSSVLNEIDGLIFR